MDEVKIFSNQLFLHLCQREGSKGGIIKRHNDNFIKYGEFSFPWKIDTWKCYIALENRSKDTIKTIFDITYPDNIYESLNEPCNKLIEDSSKWNLQIHRYIIIDDRIHIYLDRASTMRKCFENLQDARPKTLNKKIRITTLEGNKSDITFTRLKMMSNVVKNLAIAQGYDLYSQGDISADFHIHFTLKSSDNQHAAARKILCAPVLNNVTGLKETELTIDEYTSKRTTDMQLIAQHKYGLRISNETTWKIFLAQLGEAAVTFDLLQIKPSHSVTINLVNNGTGCSKGASFVLYNCARLTSIINTFSSNVQKGIYPKLPPLSEVDFTLLNDEDEWFLVFNYLFTQQSLIKQCLDVSDNKCLTCPHHLCNFLSGMVGRISMYYRRVRILLEPREHLLPMVFARIHLLISLQKVLHNCLSILNIQPVSQM